jgi:transposase
VLALLEPLNAQIAAADARLAQRAAGDPVVARLTTAPTIGPVTAVAFVATLDDVGRFESAHRVAAYWGLTPSERSSGEQQRRGRISKTGNPRLRSLLVEAAWRILRTTQPGAAGLRAWAEQIAARRGRSVAAVALARRLAGILYAMWRDGRDYRGLRLAGTA